MIQFEVTENSPKGIAFSTVLTGEDEQIYKQYGRAYPSAEWYSVSCPEPFKIWLNKYRDEADRQGIGQIFREWHRID